MPCKVDRKEAIRKFKEQKTARGAYVISCTPSGKKWVGASPNLTAARNSSWFSLGNKSHIDKTLQAEWNAHGEAAFLFQVLETLGEDVAALNLRDELKAINAKWAAQLSARTLL